MPKGSGNNSQGNHYNTPGGTNSSSGSSYHCEFRAFDEFVRAHISFQDSPRVAFLTPEAQTQSIGVGFERGVVDCLFFVCMDLCDIGIPPPSLFDFRLQSIHRRLTAPYV